MAESPVAAELSGAAEASGAAELMASNPQGSMNEEIAKKIVSAGYSLLDVLNEIMEYAKTISGVQQPVAYKKFSPKALSEYVINLFKPAILRKNLKLTLEVDENIPEILIGDAFRLKHILINLISNAIKFTEKGKVNLSAMELTGKIFDFI